MNLPLIVFHSVMSFFATVSFSLIFNAPRKELFYCGINGFISWFVYESMVELSVSKVIATFLSTVALTAVARFFSYHRQVPSTLYHIAGIMSIVPGMMIYRTMMAATESRILDTYELFFDVFQLASAIGAGSIFVLILPYRCFELFKKKTAK